MKLTVIEAYISDNGSRRELRTIIASPKIHYELKKLIRKVSVIKDGEYVLSHTSAPKSTGIGWLLFKTKRNSNKINRKKSPLMIGDMWGIHRAFDTPDYWWVSIDGGVLTMEGRWRGVPLSTKYCQIEMFRNCV